MAITLPLTCIKATSLDEKAPAMPESLVETTEQKVGRIAYLIFSIIVFPVGLVRLIGYIIHKIALPYVVAAATYRTKEESEHGHKRLRTQGAGEAVAFRTPHKDWVRGSFIAGKEHPEKVALLFGGNGWLSADALSNDAFRLSTLGISRCAVDYPGIGQSGGSLTVENLPLTVYSALHYLVKERKIDPKDIVVCGFSLGGSVIAKGIALFEEENPGAEISIVSSHGFSHFSAGIGGFVTSFAGSFVGGLAQSLCWSSGLNLENKEAFDRLRGKKLVVYDKEDDVIPYWASLAKAIHTDSRYKAVSEEKDSSLTILEERKGRHSLGSSVETACAQKIASMLQIPFTSQSQQQSLSSTHYVFVP